MKNAPKTTKKSLDKTQSNSVYFYTCISFITLYILLCLCIVFYSSNTSNITLTKANITSNFSLILFGIFYTLNLISFFIIEKQGANKKTKILFFALVISQTLAICLYYIFLIYWVSLFISAISLFFSLQLLHELKKTNKKAYFLNLPVCLICAYFVINFYIISMIN